MLISPKSCGDRCDIVVLVVGVTGATLTLGPDLVLLGSELADRTLTQQDLLLPFEVQLDSTALLVLRDVKYDLKCTELLRLQKAGCDLMPRDIQVCGEVFGQICFSM